MQIRNYTSNEERKLYELKNKIENKLNGNPIDYSIKDSKNKEEKNNPIKISNNIESGPINLDDQEFLCRIMGKEISSSAMDGIITNGNAGNYVINNKISNLNDENIFTNALSCLKGDKLIVPKKNSSQ